jgi:hypothetical protein
MFVKYGVSFTATGIATAARTCLKTVEERLLYRRPGRRGVGDDTIDVELERVGSRALDAVGVVEPAPAVRGVEARDDGNSDRILEPPDMLEVRMRPSQELLGIDVVVARRLRLRVAGGGLELFLEQREENDCTRARLLELLDGSDFARERRRRDHERRPQFQPHVFAVKVRAHRNSPTALLQAICRRMSARIGAFRAGNPILANSEAWDSRAWESRPPAADPVPRIAPYPRESRGGTATTGTGRTLAERCPTGA